MILIVEDEDKLARVIGEYLQQAGFETACLADGTQVVAWVHEQKPELVLLDLMLPGKGGLDICKEIRATSSVPIIITTAKVEEIDRLLGLELGADDYICKPFSPREVVARVKAVLRRTAPSEPINQQQILVLDESRHSAILYGHELNLTHVEFKLLLFLSSKAGRIYGREALMDHIYPDERVVADRTIDSHIKKLRKKIMAICPDEELIHSVYGVGYKFEVREKE